MLSRTFVAYSLQRLVLLLVTFLLLHLVGVRGFPGALAALLISSILSLFLLRRQRAALIREGLARREAREAERTRVQQRLTEEP